MTENLVARLRSEATQRFQEGANDLLSEGADEIERLTRELWHKTNLVPEQHIKHLEAKIERLKLEIGRLLDDLEAQRCIDLLIISERQLLRELAKAGDRATRIADRLMGGEPTPLAWGQGSKDAVEPPLMARLSGASQLAKELIEHIHYQLNRLERL